MIVELVGWTWVLSIGAGLLIGWTCVKVGRREGYRDGFHHGHRVGYGTGVRNMQQTLKLSHDIAKHYNLQTTDDAIDKLAHALDPAGWKVTS